MKRPAFPQRFMSTPQIGAKVSYRRTLTEADVALFIGVTWDVNPLHTDDEYVAATPLGRRIVPGLLTVGLLTHLGGLWAFMATEMQIEYLAPVFINDTVTAEAEVVEFDQERGYVRLLCQCLNQNGEKVLKAEVSGYPGRFTMQD